MIGTAYPMKVSDALLSTARDAAAEGHRHGQRVLDQHAGGQARLPRPRHVAARQQPRADAPHAACGPAAIGGRNLFEHDFRVCDAYANGLDAAAARWHCPTR
jgi:hypothetical protein